METTPIIPGMIDTHFHTLEMKKKGLSPEAELSRCFESGLAAVVDISISLRDFRQRLSISRQFDAIFHTLGLSPGESEDPHCMESLISLNDVIEDGDIIALGEIGLDYYWNYATPKKQKDLFGAQLEIAAEHDLPVVIHNRNADKDIYEMLKTAHLSQGGVIHCFSSTKETALRFVDLGFYISFAGNVTYKKSEELLEAASAVPLPFLLAETDAPYLTPVPKRGKPNSPEYVGYVYRFLSDLRGIELAEFVAQIKENVQQVFRLNLPE